LIICLKNLDNVKLAIVNELFFPIELQNKRFRFDFSLCTLNGSFSTYFEKLFEQL